MVWQSLLALLAVPVSDKFPKRKAGLYVSCKREIESMHLSAAEIRFRRFFARMVLVLIVTYTFTYSVRGAQGSNLTGVSLGFNPQYPLFIPLWTLPKPHSSCCVGQLPQFIFPNSNHGGASNSIQIICIFKTWILSLGDGRNITVKKVAL